MVVFFSLFLSDLPGTTDEKYPGMFTLSCPFINKFKIQYNSVFFCVPASVALLIKQPNGLVYTFTFHSPPGVSSQWPVRTSEVLFKTQAVQGGSDISALRATGRAGSFLIEDCVHSRAVVLH